MQREKEHQFGLRKQLVLFTTFLAIITYSTSMCFIYVLYPLIQEHVPFSELSFTIGTLLLGILSAE